MRISLTEFENALAALEEALRMKKSDITRDAAIQRFEFTIELAWKTTRRIMGTDATAPKVVIREMARQRLIDNPEEWIEFIDDRNLTSHTYKQEIAEKVFHSAQKFAPLCRLLIKRIKNL